MSRTEPFLRTPTRATGPLTAEEEVQMARHSRLWIDRAFRTAPADPDKLIPAIKALYAVTDQPEPRVIVVPSPLVMAMAGGFASAIWHARKHGWRQATGQATWQATEQATWQATWQATRQATGQATRQATGQATGQATRQATRQATGQATGQATWQATEQATEQATWQAENRGFYDFFGLALEIGGSPEMARFMLSCANNWGVAYQGGNMWAAYDCYLSAARDVLGLQLPEHEKYAAWEQCAIEGSFRWMHPEFCLVCDFPEVLLADEQGRPHCADGPSHRWRDGWSLYHWHGVRVPEYVIERPEEITVELIGKEPNAEIRRVMIERYGAGRYLYDSGAEVISHDAVGILYRKAVADDEPIVMVRVLNSTPEPDGVMSRDDAIAIFGPAAKAAADAPEGSRFKEYTVRVPPSMRTAHEAVAWTFGLTAETYHPALET